MDNEILQSIVEMTRQRDLDSLEYSLAATLAELVPAQRISLNKFLKDGNHDQLEEVVHLFIDKDSKNEPSYEWNHEPKIIMADEHITLCIEGLKPVSYKDKGFICLLMPILSSSKVIGVLSIESKQELSEFETLIDGFTKIYGNYLYILNESERDKLTGLFNRRTFDNKLKRLLKMQRKKQEEYTFSESIDEKRKLEDSSCAWLVMLDIDHFKAVNDTFGHLYGDEVILLISQRMKKCFRNSDLLFRFGGEEFVIVLEPVSTDQAYTILDNFRQTISDHNFPQIGTVTISIGYAMIRENDFPPIILDLADKALYYAKEHGRNCVYKYESLIADGDIQDQKKSGEIDLF
ncbi:MAG: sensor domain-containing diguanylate cyclase [Gammaproteobacteria bacterium]|nr:MAG: sensor domain-containing diguanylate cyclase [Gammaproteobacteria bacterium]